MFATPRDFGSGREDDGFTSRHLLSAKLASRLEEEFGNLFSLDERTALVTSTLAAIQPIGTPSQREEWFYGQIQERALEHLLAKPLPPTFSPAWEALLCCLLRHHHPYALSLLVAYAPRLERAIASKYPSFALQEREDIVMDGLVRVYEKGTEFNPAYSKLSTWITKIVSYRALGDLRLPISSRQLDTLANSIPDRSIEESNLDDDTPSPAMQVLIDQLPPQRAKALFMHYFQGMSFQAIAEAMSTNEVTVRAYLSRARRDLERLMGDDMTFIRRTGEPSVSGSILSNAIVSTAEATPEIVVLHPPTPVAEAQPKAAIDAATEPMVVQSATNSVSLGNGALGSVARDVDTQEALSSQIATTGRAPSPSLAAKVKTPALPHRLNAHEISILQMTADYYTAPEIATKLCLSLETVEEYWQRLKRKLSARNKPHAAAIAFTLGIIH